MQIKQLPFVVITEPSDFCNNGSHNRPFPGSLVPLFQDESKCETIDMKMSSACCFIFMQIKVISIREVANLDSF